MALLHACIDSTALQQNMSLNVLLPERECPYLSGRWPVLYLLHGLSDDHTIWSRRTSIERYVDGMNLAVVMPAVHRSFYTDMKHGGKYFTYISEELPALCERLFHVSSDRTHRFAAGLSMGGYGAFKLGLRCPERFAAVASLSGAVDMLDVDVDATLDPAWSFLVDIFGTAAESKGSDDDLIAVARRRIAEESPMPKFFMACGTEDFLYQSNVKFHREFGNALNIEYQESPGSHTWDFWDRTIQDVLAWLPIVAP